MPSTVWNRQENEEDESQKEGAEENHGSNKSLPLVTKGSELFGLCNNFFSSVVSISIFLTSILLPFLHPTPVCLLFDGLLA